MFVGLGNLFYYIFPTIIVGFITLFIFYLPFRFYICSYFFSELYDNPQIANLLGIRFVSINEWKTSREHSRIFSCGVFVKLLKLITGMDLRIGKETMKELICLQNDFSRDINMEPYFKEIDKKKINLQEFEYFISRVLLIETNRAFGILNDIQQEELIGYIGVIFDVLNGLSGGMIDGFYMMITNFVVLFKVSMLLRTLPEAKRLIIFGPQLSLVSNFTKMIWRKRGILDNLEPHDFLDLSTKFFVFDTWEKGYHELIFVKRDERDTSNAPTNKAFGPYGVVCPGALMTMNYIRSILSFLKSFNITFDGNAEFVGSRFKNIINKKEVYVLFEKKHTDDK